MADKKKTARLTLDRIGFETLVEAHAKTAEDILDEIKSGKIKKNHWLFTKEDVINLCERVAIGFWHNCRVTENHKSKWNKEYGRKQVTKIVTNAFTSQ